jgi:isopenicillin-N N-acyltransferase like protein
MRVVHLQGTPSAMGEAMGESLRQEIHELYERRLQNAIEQARTYGNRSATAADVLDLAHACVAPTEAYDPRGFQELVGIARGAGLTLDQVLAMNGLTDLRDVLAFGGGAAAERFGGCTSFVAQRDATRDGRILAGQTWDLATDNMPYVIGVHRRPADGPATFCLTTVGCLSLIGLNDEGIGVGTTNIRTRDSRPGVTYLSLVHRALSCRSFEEAVNAVLSARRAGGHYYYLVDRAGHAAAIECSALSAERIDVTRGAHVHTNHCLAPGHQAIEADTPTASSHARQKRMEALLSQHHGAVDVELVRGFLADRENGDNAICRDGEGGISTNGAIVLSPEGPAVQACQGPPDRARWIDLLAG